MGKGEDRKIFLKVKKDLTPGRRRRERVCCFDQNGI